MCLTTNHIVALVQIASLLPIMSLVIVFFVFPEILISVEAILIISSLSILAMILILFHPSFEVFMTSVRYVAPPVRAKIPMISLYNPFTFDVNLNDSSLEGVQCTYSSLKNCYVLLLWGVPIFPLFMFLNQPWRKIKSIMDSPSENPFLSSCTSYMDPFFLNAEERRTTMFRPPAEYEKNKIRFKKGSRRSRYPLVAIMVLQNNSDVQDNIMIAMATVLHLPDSPMQKKLFVIGQFVKPESGTIGVVKKTYPSSFETVNQSGETVHLCIVCYNNEASLVILPCNHACTCNSCFEKLERCPICRERAVSYFELL